MHAVFVAGLSGSGKTTVMAALEDLDFYCVDNLPSQLVLQFLDLCAKASPAIEKVALAVDSREAPFLRSLPGVAKQLRDQGVCVEGVFLESSNEVLVNRYRETRRVHPHSRSGNVEEGIARERKQLAELADFCDFEIDTSNLNVHQLKETIVKLVSGRVLATVVNIVSFGFRWGVPHGAELLFDVRFLPNPHFERLLREGTGRDSAVAKFVLESERGSEFLDRLCDFMGFLIPNYENEGKAYLTVGIGCTGGRHRSVAMAQALAEFLRQQGREINLEHRDIERIS